MKYLAILLLFIISKNSRAQNINFNWVKKLEKQTGLPVEESYFIGTDEARNVYVAGNFHNTIDLDPSAGVTTVSNPFENIFISKFNSAGVFIWGKHLGKNEKYTVCKSLSVDASGNVYTTGYFNGTADFDPGPATYNLISTTATGFENNDVFISKLDANGNFQWAKQIGGNNVDIGNSIYADVFGNVYTAGYITGAVNLDPGDGATVKGARDLVTGFIVKLDAAGNFKFAKAFEGNHLSEVKYIRTDSKGNIYTSGYFGGIVDFDPGAGVRSFTTDAIFTQETFLSKLDASGNFIWAIRDIIGLDIAVDYDENVYSHSSTLAKYDKDGSLVWKKQIGGIPNSLYRHNVIQVDGSGNIYLSGHFRFTQDFDPGPSVFNLTTTGGGYASDVFISKLDRDGNFLYAKSFGGKDEDYATGLSITSYGEVYTTGLFLQQVDFDPGGQEFKISSSSFGNVFVHKMSPCKNTPPTFIDIVSCKSYTLNKISYDSSGTYTQILNTDTGCDSIIKLNLTIKIASSNKSITTCSNYKWSGRLLTTSGHYTDTLQTPDGCDSAINLGLKINRLSIIKDTSICTGQSYNGHNTTGDYTDTLIAANGCDSVVNLSLVVMGKPAPKFGVNREICTGDSINLQPGSFETYQWQDGTTKPSFIAKKPGIYSVLVSNSCGVAKEEINIVDGVCKTYFPNAFTPNNDGRNEGFMLLRPYNISNYSLNIYNRHGKKIFETKDYTKPWRGIYRGVLAPEGVYIWYSQFKEAGVLKNMKGNVVLIR